MKLTNRKKSLWGLTTPRRFLQLNYGIRALLLLFMWLPAVIIGWGVTFTLLYSYEGDAVSTDWRVIAALVAFIVFGVFLTRMMANRLILQYIILKRQKYEKDHFNAGGTSQRIDN